MLHPIGCLRLRQAGAGDVFLRSEAWSDCCHFVLPSCWAMTGITSEKDMKVWSPINTKRATRASAAQCTCEPERTTSTLPRILGDRASPEHPCGLAQAALPGTAYYLAERILGALCPHSWAAKFGTPVRGNFLPLG